MLRISRSTLMIGLLMLGACQPPQGPTAPSKPLSQTQLLSRAVTQPEGQLTLDGGVLRFEMQYPTAFLQRTLAAQKLAAQKRGFAPQVLDYARFVRFQVSVVGIGMSPLYPAAADAEQNHTIPVTGCTQATGCTLNTSIADVPAGENRVAVVQAYDAEGEVIPGSTLAAVFTLPEGTDPYTVRLSYRSQPLAAIAQELLGIPADHLLLSQLDPVAGQQFLDQIMGGSGDTYTTHPALLNIANLVTDIKAENGNFANLSPTNPDYVTSPGTVSGTVTGLVSTDTVTLRLSDPATGAVVNQSNADFTFSNVPPGTWLLSVDAPAGYTVSGVPSEVVVTEGGTMADLEVVLTPTLPVLTSVSPGTQAPGQTLTLTGEHFHSTPEGNVVTIGDITLPASAIEVVSDTTLNVTLPPDIPLGTATVSVSVGTQTAVNQPTITIQGAGPINLQADNITTSSFDVTWNAVANAEKYRVYRFDQEVAEVLTPTYTFTGLDPASLSTVKVVAVVDGEDSLPSNNLDVYTLSDWTTWTALGPNTEQVLAATAHVGVTDTVFFGSKVAGASLGGVWRCVDTNCVQKADATVAGSVQALAVAPENATVIYAGSETLGVLKSTDSGETWTPMNQGLSGTALNVRRILTDPQRPGHLYIGTRGSGVWMSTDGAETWTEVNAGLPDHFNHRRDVGALSLYQPDTGLPTLFLGTQGSGVFKSTGGDASQVQWQAINDGLPGFFGSYIFSLVDVTVMLPHPTEPTQQYGAALGACTIPFACQADSGNFYEPGVWRRIDPNDWLQLGHDGLREYDDQANSPDVSTGLNNMQVYDLIFDPSNDQHMYAATGDGVYRSTDEGLSWSKYDAGLPSGIQANVLAMHPRKLFMGTNQGLFLAQ